MVEERVGRRILCLGGIDGGAVLPQRITIGTDEDDGLVRAVRRRPQTRQCAAEGLNVFSPINRNAHLTHPLDDRVLRDVRGCQRWIQPWQERWPQVRVTWAR